MLNPFPDLLVLGFFAPTLVRIAAGCAFLYLARMQYNRREEIKQLDLPFVGKNSWWYAASATANAAIGTLLVFGVYTQFAALLATVGLFKGLWLNRRHPSVVILPNSTVLILIAICLSLLLSGAGAFAFDLPL